jgi:hypothetical protein
MLGACTAFVTPIVRACPVPLTVTFGGFAIVLSF